MPGVELLVFGTIAAAVLAWAWGEVFTSRVAWTLGAVLALVHSVAAFVTFYEGSHAIARAETARQTTALSGVDFEGGIYVNYLFLAVWIADAGWWWYAPQNYPRRSALLSSAIRGFIFFIIVNGAVVFADGWARVVGTASVILVISGWFLKRSSRHGAITTAG